MAISVIRKATQEDIKRLNSAAFRFAKRHSIPLDDWPGGPAPYEDLTYTLDYCGLPGHDYAHLRHLWQACLCRALALKPSTDITISYGHIGYQAD